MVASCEFTAASHALHGQDHAAHVRAHVNPRTHDAPQSLASTVPQWTEVKGVHGRGLQMKRAVTEAAADTAALGDAAAASLGDVETG